MELRIIFIENPGIPGAFAWFSSLFEIIFAGKIKQDVLQRIAIENFKGVEVFNSDSIENFDTLCFQPYFGIYTRKGYRLKQ